MNDINSKKYSLSELEKIALKPRILADEQYITDMIEIEEKEHKAGYKERIQGLEIMMEQAKQLNNILKQMMFPIYSNHIIKLLKN